MQEQVEKVVGKFWISEGLEYLEINLSVLAKHGASFQKRA